MALFSSPTLANTVAMTFDPGSIPPGTAAGDCEGGGPSGAIGAAAAPPAAPAARWFGPDSKTHEPSRSPETSPNATPPAMPPNRWLIFTVIGTGPPASPRVYARARADFKWPLGAAPPKS